LPIERSLSHFFMSVRPHVKTNRLKITHGNQAIHTLAPTTVAGLDPPSIGQISFGRHTVNNAHVAPNEQTDAITSTSRGPGKFETRNCGTANDNPATKAAGQTPSIPRNPANAQTTQNGTSSEKNGR